ALDIAAAAHDAWAPFAERARRQSVRFDVAAGGVSALADPDALRQVLGNLFDNALRYTPPGGTIAVRAGAVAPAAEQPADTAARAGQAVARRDAGARVANEVRDTGAGIPGDVTVESMLGKGTTIRFTLPAAASMAPAGGAGHDAVAAA